MRIAFLITDNREHQRRYGVPVPYFGPAPEAVLAGLATIRELEVHVVACTQRPMKSPEKLADNTWFHLLHVPKFGWMRTGYQGCIRAIRRHLRALKPDLVHGQGTERECALSAIFSGFPNVITVHGNMAQIKKHVPAPFGGYYWLAALLEGFALARTDGVFCNSAYTEDLIRPRARRTWRVPNALRPEFFAPLPPVSPIPQPVFLNIGVVGPRKRQLELLSVAEELHCDGLKFELHFIGDADPHERYAAEFLHRVRAAEARGYARHLGTKTTAEVLASCDAASALVHVPSEEAFGLVVAEALARNLKFFGTDIGGIRDIAAGVQGAELFPLEDRDALQAAIAAWLRAGSPRPSAAADEMRRRYHPEVIARRHVEIYRELLADRGSGAACRASAEV